MSTIFKMDKHIFGIISALALGMCIFIWTTLSLLDKQNSLYTKEDLKQELTKQRLVLSKHYNDKLKALKQELIDDTPYKPTLTLSDDQNKLCLAIGVFGEERMGSETDFVVIAQSILSRTEREWFGATNACAVLAHKSDNGTLAYSSMGPYIGDLSDIVWGNINTFTPWLAKQKEADMDAWKRIVKVTSDVIDGKYPRMTIANHFVALDKLKTVPGWVRKLRPVGTTSGHVLFVDYEIREGEVVRYTKDNPYNQAEFNKKYWETPTEIVYTNDDILKVLKQIN